MVFVGFSKWMLDQVTNTLTCSLSTYHMTSF